MQFQDTWKLMKPNLKRACNRLCRTHNCALLLRLHWWNSDVWLPSHLFKSYVGMIYRGSIVWNKYVLFMFVRLFPFFLTITFIWTLVDSKVGCHQMSKFPCSVFVDWFARELSFLLDCAIKSKVGWLHGIDCFWTSCNKLQIMVEWLCFCSLLTHVLGNNLWINSIA